MSNKVISQRASARNRPNSSIRHSARTSRQGERHLSVRGELREKPDIRRIARAIIDMEMARHEAEAVAQVKATPPPSAESSDA